jgi:hypothetical protein
MTQYTPNSGSGQSNDVPSRRSYWRTGGLCFLCLASVLIATVLLLVIIFVVLQVPLGFRTFSFRVLVTEVLHSIFVPIIVFTAEIIKSLFPWPIIAIAFFLLLAWGPDRIRQLISLLNFEVPGLKFAGTGTAPDAFRQEMNDAQKTVVDTNKEIERAYAAAKESVVQLRERYGIDKSVGDLSVAVAQIVGPGCPDDFRLTIYVPDFVFGDQLYQLAEYYDKQGKRTTEGKTGRVFSIRYGIIGRVWRSGVAEVEGELISKEDQALINDPSDVREVEKFIARRWGLTLNEATRVRPYQSYGAIRIQRGERPPGLVFFDSKKTNAFGGPETIGKIDLAVQNSELAISLLEISREIGELPRIQIFKSV